MTYDKLIAASMIITAFGMIIFSLGAVPFLRFKNELSDAEHSRYQNRALVGAIFSIAGIIAFSALAFAYI